MKRRDVLVGMGSLAAAASLGRPARAQTAKARVLKFIPEGNLSNPDPIWTTTTVARNHSFMIYDTLYGVDAKLSPKPQMCEGHELSSDQLTWTFALREKLKFHDGEPVRAADCVASIARWMKRDSMGQVIALQLDAMRAVDDRKFEIRLKKPFPLLLQAFAKPAANVCFIMPERIAKTDAFTQISEYVGSGPFKFLRSEWVPGALAAYGRFEDYAPRAEAPEFTSGGKVAHFDRVEWNIIPDSATAAAAIVNGEADWWQSPITDLLPMLRKGKGVVVESVDRIGNIEVLRFNSLQPPFNNVKLRQAVLKAVNRKEFMQAAFGDETTLYSVENVGVFTPGSPSDTDIGLDILNSPRDLAAAKKLVAESGYAGEKVVIISPSDYPWLRAFCDVAREVCVNLGLNVDLVTMDWGTLVQRRASKEPVEKGGWSIFCTGWEGLNLADPAGHYPILGSGQQAWFGWPTSPRIEGLRADWFTAPDKAAQKKATDGIQAAVWEEVPYIPLGQYFQPIAHRSTITNIISSPFPIFWNVRGREG